MKPVLQHPLAPDFGHVRKILSQRFAGMADRDTLTLKEHAHGIRKIFVVGAGQMGHGIAQVARRRNMKSFCMIFLRNWRIKAKPRSVRSRSFGAKRKDDGRWKDSLLSRIHTVSDLKEAAAADLAIEAATENMEIKKKIFAQLDTVCRPEVILATNTSSPSVTALAAVTKHPDKVIGMHFFNPVPVMKLIEIVRGLATSDETYQTIYELPPSWAKRPPPCPTTPASFPIAS
jgi:3-hydroxybutyryl-CoA dehydrogenase